MSSSFSVKIQNLNQGIGDADIRRLISIALAQESIKKIERLSDQEARVTFDRADICEACEVLTGISLGQDDFATEIIIERVIEDIKDDDYEIIQQNSQINEIYHPPKTQEKELEEMAPQAFELISGIQNKREEEPDISTTLKIEKQEDSNILQEGPPEVKQNEEPEEDNLDKQESRNSPSKIPQEDNLDKQESRNSPSKIPQEDNLDKQESTNSPSKKPQEDNLDKQESTNSPSKIRQQDVTEQIPSTTVDSKGVNKDNTMNSQKKFEENKKNEESLREVPMNPKLEIAMLASFLLYLILAFKC